MTLIEVIMIAGFLAGAVAGACFGQRFGNVAAIFGAIAGAALGLGAAALFLNLLFRLADLSSPRKNGKTTNTGKTKTPNQTGGR